MIISILFCLIFNIHSYADNVLRPEHVGRYTVNRTVDDELIDDDELFDDDEFYDESEDFYYASDSEYFINVPSYDSSFAISLEDYFLKLENKPIEIDSVFDIDDESEVLLMDNGDTMLRSPARSLSFNDEYKNTVIISGTFGGSSCRLIIPSDSYDQLSVIDGVLCNVGSSAVSGRLLYGSDDLTPSAYDTYSYILNPVYGSTANVWRYGSFNYRRHYYLYTNSSTGSQSIQYSDTYGNFIVKDIDYRFQTNNRTYYLGLVGLLVGGLALCLKRS